MQLIIGIFLGILVATLAWKARALNRSGAVAAAVSGGLIFGLGGLPWATLLLTFFISSSVLSRAFSRRKQTLSEKFSKGHQRDWGQVLANGGLGALMVLVHAVMPNEIWPWVAFSGAMAAVNADTWATELGVLNPSAPRLITNGQQVERGTSGAISLWGSLAALGGAALVGSFSAMFRVSAVPFVLLGSIILGGLSGSFFDSFLGATIQSIYWCPICQKETERYPLHLCGTQTIQQRGWSWLDNDWVNFGASVIGALVAVVMYQILAS